MECVIIRANPHDVNPAVPRALTAGKDVFSRMTVLCWNHKPPALPAEAELDGAPIHRFHYEIAGFSLAAVVGVLRYQFWVLGWLLKIRPRYVQALDIYSVLPAAAARLILGCHLIYDMRDPFALSFDFSPVVRRAAYAMDWVLMGLSSSFVVPDESRVAYLGRWGQSHRPVAVVLNTCHDELARAEAVALPDLPPDHEKVRIAFLGYLAYSRGARSLIDLCRPTESPAQLWSAGACSPASMADDLAAGPNLRWWGKQPWESCLALIRECDVVAILYDPKMAGNRMAAPNKLYEALMLGRPVLVSDRMEMSPWIRREGLGYAVPYDDMDALRGVADKLADPAERARVQARCRAYFLEHLTLGGELVKYTAFYRGITRGRRTAA